ncbi:MAG TPA: cytochrome c [Terriglobales bacterium]|nr:cytochrome c [Terriglobales bacterium]
MNRPLKYSLFLALLLALAVGISGWLILRRGFSAREQPSAMEAIMARTMRSLATPSTAKALKSPLKNSPENLQMGLEHFADHCSVCHSNNGDGDNMYGRNMYPKPPDLRQSLTQDLTDGEIYFIIQNGIRLTGMPAFGQPNRTDDQGSWQLVQFIRHLPRLTPDQEAEMKRLNPVSPLDVESDEDFLSGEDTSKMKMKHAPSKEHKH